MTCLDCGSAIEEGRKDRAPVAARFCLKCRPGRRRQHNLKYRWVPQHEAYMRAHHHGGRHQRGRVIKDLAWQTPWTITLLRPPRNKVWLPRDRKNWNTSSGVASDLILS